MIFSFTFIIVFDLFFKVYIIFSNFLDVFTLVFQ